MQLPAKPKSKSEKQQNPKRLKCKNIPKKLRK
jgi:hypothetical protein